MELSFDIAAVKELVSVNQSIVNYLANCYQSDTWKEK